MGQKPLYYGELPGGGLPSVRRRKRCSPIPRSAVVSTGTAWSAISSTNTCRPLSRFGTRSENCLRPHSHLGGRRHSRLGTGILPLRLCPDRILKRQRSNSGMSYEIRWLAIGAPTFRSVFSCPEGSTHQAWPPRSARLSLPGMSGRTRSDSRIPASMKAATPAPSRDYLGTEHHERTFSIETAFELLPEVTHWLDEPFGDASILPTHLLSRFARGEVKVVLGGDGADELLAGYPTFTAERAAWLFRQLPGPAQTLVGAAVGRLPVDHRNFSFDFKLKQFLRGAAEPLPLAHQALARLLFWSRDRTDTGRRRFDRCRTTTPPSCRRSGDLRPTRCLARWPCISTLTCLKIS